MRIYEVINSLGEMLGYAKEDRKMAFALYASSELLVDWIYKQAIGYGVAEYPLKEKLRDVRRGFRHACGLVSEDEMTRDPITDARSALNFLSCGTMIGAVDGLLFKNITDN